jgi:catecholate siderophore receptor
MHTNEIKISGASVGNDCLTDKRVFAQVSLGVAASMLMASAATAQTTLPPLAVETKKAAPKAKAKAAPKAKQAPPPAVAAQPAAPVDPSLLPGSYTTSTASSGKQTAPLLNTPQTVTVIPGTIIQERQATNLTEVLRNTPGISFNAGENGFGTNVSNFQIRGFDASNSVFVDGMRSSGVFPRDVYNVDRVEVFKGPAADNGRGSAGGYVNIVTKAPVMENFARAEVGIGFDEYDSEMRRRATFDLNQRVGTTAVRLNGMVEDGGVAGRDVAEAKAWAFAPSITFGMGTDTRLTIAYEHIKRDDRPDWGVPGAFIPGTINYNSPNYARIPGQRYRDNFYGLNSDTDRITGDSVLAKLQYDLSDTFTWTNQVRWARVDRYAAYTLPTGVTAPAVPGDPVTQVTTARNFYDREISSLSGQSEITGRFRFAGFDHKMAAGVEFSHEEADANRFGTASPASGPTSISNPNPGRAFPSASITERNKVEVDTVAAYLYDTINLTRQVQLTTGIRAERYKVSINSTNAAGVPLGAPGTWPYEDSETSLSGKLGLVYKPVPQGTLYAAYSTSVLPHGSLLSTPDISRTGDNAFPGFVRDADTMRLHSYELGVKWDFFGGRLTTAAALFRTEKHNAALTGCSVLVTAPLTSCPAANRTLGYGKQIVQGLEIAVAGNLTESWKVFGGMALIDSERKHSAELDQLRYNDAPGDRGNNPLLRTSGDELAFTPRFTANLWSTYKVTDAFTVGAGVQYVGESWVGRPDDALRIIPNGRAGKLPDYFLVNFMAQYDVTSNIALRLNVDNVFDEFYARSLNWNASRADLGAPRTYWLSASFKY